MKVRRAAAMGMCFGVKDALARAFALSRPEDVTIHGELVHNEEVLARLDAAGFRQRGERERGRPIDSSTVLVTAHGISERERARLGAAGHSLVDTTCPLVRRVHDAARELAAEGRLVLVLGRPGHVEVQGIVEDLDRCEVVPDAGCARAYGVTRLGVVCQSTFRAEEAERVVEAVRAANPDADVRFSDTVCDPTRRRVEAVRALAAITELIVVVGGRNSNNTAQLVALCRARGRRAYHVQGPGDLDPDWFRGVDVVGLTAGTSTPDDTIDAVEAALRALPCTD